MAATLDTISDSIGEVNEAWAAYKASSAPLSEASQILGEKGRERLLLAARSLVSRVQEPSDAVRDICYQPAHSAALSVAVGAGLVDALPTDGSAMTATQMAEVTGAEEALIVRIMRSLRANMFCNEPEPYCYSHGPMTQVLAENPSAKAALMYTISTFHAILPHLNNILRQTGYKEPHGDVDRLGYSFDDIQPTLHHLIIDDPDRKTNYSIAMAVSEKGGQNLPLLRKYDFPQKFANVPAGEYSLVDVGGGTGQLLREVITAFPGWEPKTMLQDQPEAIEIVKSRSPKPYFEYMVHNYFELQPIKAHGYLFRQVFVDNTDEQARRMLRALKPVFEPNATKLIIIESTLPENGASLRATAIDITVMTYNGAKNRTLKDYRDLLASEDFTITGVWADDEQANKLIMEAVLSKT